MCSRPVGRTPLTTRFFFASASIANLAASALSAEQFSCDDHALNLAGAFVDRYYAGVAVHALDVSLARIAYAAVNLHRFIDYAIHHLAGVQVLFRSHRATLARMRVLQPRVVLPQAAGRFDFRLPVGQHPLNGLKLADVFAKGAALLRVLHGFFERALCKPDG